MENWVNHGRCPCTFAVSCTTLSTRDTDDVTSEIERVNKERYRELN